MAFLPISVIIPTRNRRSILERTFPGYLDLPVEQIVVLDDASSDDTETFCQSFSDERIVVVRHERRQGLPRARNSGMAAASQPFILMGEDDVMIDRSYVTLLWDQKEKLNADFVAGRLIAMQRGESSEDALRRCETENHSRFAYPKEFRFDFTCHSDHPVETPFLHACSLYARKWAKRFPYDPAFRGNALREESDFYLRCYEAGACLFFCPAAVAYHLFHDLEGGCRGSSLAYAGSSLLNNHRFFNRHWKTVRELLEIDTSKWRHTIQVDSRLLRMTLLFWMNARVPRTHALLKRIAVEDRRRKAEHKT